MELTQLELEANFRNAAAALMDFYGSEPGLLFVSITALQSGQILTVAENGYAHIVPALVPEAPSA